MRVKLYASAGLLDVPVYEGDLPGWYEELPPMTVVFNNRQVFTLAERVPANDGKGGRVYDYISAAACFVIHTGVAGTI